MIGICGASGYIGWELFRYLKDHDEKVMGTYYKSKKRGLVKYDLREDHFRRFDDCKFVVITTAYAKIEFCRINKIEAYWLNVYRTKALLQYLHDKNIPSFFISSDIAEKPKTVYGKYKREVEQFIDKMNLDAEYIRPGKINDSNINDLCKEIYVKIKKTVRS